MDGMVRMLAAMLLAGAAFAQKYDGPRPPKADLPYIQQADNLIPTEAVQAQEQKQKRDTLYVIQGAASSARTPLASPIFLFLADKIAPEKLAVYKLEVKNGRREILFGRKPPKPVMVNVNPVEGKLYKIEVVDSLDPGQYSLSPEGSNEVFCFAVY